MRFSTRTFLFSSAPTIALLISAFFFIENLTVTALSNDAKRSLRQTQVRMAHSHARSEEESARMLKIVGENAPLKAAMQLMAVERDSPDAKRTLEDQLREICEPLDLGFLSVSYPDGTFMAGLIRTAGRWMPFEPGRPLFFLEWVRVGEWRHLYGDRESRHTGRRRSGIGFGWTDIRSRSSRNASRTYSRRQSSPFHGIGGFSRRD